MFKGRILERTKTITSTCVSFFLKNLIQNSQIFLGKRGKTNEKKKKSLLQLIKVLLEVSGEIEARGTLTVIMTRENGEVVNIPLICRLDTSAEVEVYNAGGILQKFAKDFIASA